MTVHFKESVWSTWPLTDEVNAIIAAAEINYANYGVSDLWVTSLMDSHDHNPRSRHHTKMAVDLRIWTLLPDHRSAVVEDLQAQLGDEYKIALHPVNSPTHIHGEFRRIS